MTRSSGCCTWTVVIPELLLTHSCTNKKREDSIGGRKRDKEGE